MSRNSGFDIERIYSELRLTGRGKHVRRFSYYHKALVSMREGALAHLEEVRKRLHKKSFEFNVVKLDARSCVSFLHYSEFETTPFPALREALSCDVFLGATRITVYSTRLNPPILHRKELLLPADHPLVPEATRLTEDLERLGAFEDPHQIGTRHGWTNRLASLGVDVVGSRATLRR